MSAQLGPISTSFRRRESLMAVPTALGATDDAPPPKFTIVPANDGTDDDIVTLADEDALPGEGEFYANLAETIDEQTAVVLVTDLLKRIDEDKEAREPRNEQYEEGMRRTGLGDDAPGGGAFDGASKVVHPLMTEATIDFMASEMRELMPPDGPVKTKIVGKVDPEKEARAERKARHMNLQITEDIEEFRSELEEMLSQVPLGGSQYLKVFRSEELRRSAVEFVPIDFVHVPFNTTYFYSAERITQDQHLTEEECAERIESGMYLDFDYTTLDQLPEETKPQQANDKIEGRKPPEQNTEGLRLLHECSTFWRFDERDDPMAGGRRAPYLITIDRDSQKLLSIYRNWEEDDATMRRLDTLIEFKFIPWRGAYGLGLPQLIGMLSGAATGSLRALLDSALTVTIPTLIKARGRPGGQSDVIQATQVSEVDVPSGKTLRESMQQLTFPGPSPVLVELLKMLVDWGKGVVTTAEEKIADASNNMPVGTTLALIEQGSKVVSSIHGRMHASMERVLRALHRLNRLYLDDEEVMKRWGEQIVRREDYEQPVDIIPVSDPLIFSETQRVAQAQFLAQRASPTSGAADLYDRGEVEKRLLRQFRIPDADRVLKPVYTAKNTDSVDENVSMALGRPVRAYPEQDHLAHLITHIAFFTDPRFGASPLVAPGAIMGVVGHLREHLVLWYRAVMFKQMGDDCDIEIAEMDIRKAPEELAELDRGFAIASALIATMKPDETPKEVQSILPALQVMMQAAQTGMQAMAPLMEAATPKDPMAEAAKAETQRKGQADQARAQDQQAGRQIEAGHLQLDQQEAQRKAADDAAEQERLRAKDQAEQAEADASIEQKDKAAELAAQVKLTTNREDNQTALIITGIDRAGDAEGRDSNVTTGTGINPGP